MGLIKDLLKATFISLFIAGIVAAIAGGTVYKRISTYDIEQESITITPSTTIVFDKFGDKMAEFRKNDKEMIHYEEIPKEMIEAVLATEDRDFFDHSGINPKAIFRAGLVVLRSGGYSQGGSTVTQQLVKQIYLDSGKNLERKQKEAILSTILEQKFTKKEIISYYVNHNFYGNRSYGFENALYTYFGQTLKDLKDEDKVEKVAKVALLAAMPNAPSYFNPYKNPEPTLQRRNLVLTNMYIEGYINEETYNEAIKLDMLVLDEPKSSDENNKSVRYPELTHYALSEASEKLGLTLDEVMESGNAIHTTFDPRIYDGVRKIVSQDKYYPKNYAATEDIQASTTFVNPKNGEILSMTGSKKQINEFLILNRAFQSKRQPGSSFKPLIAYGPALESGKLGRYSGLSCQSDYNGYKVRDYGCWGNPTMQESIRVSKNATAVWTLNHVGIKYAREYVEKLGINLSDNDVYLPMALGGLERGVTTLEMSDAFQAYANGGMRSPAHAVTSIKDQSGKVIYEPDEPKRVIKEENANTMKEMLRLVVSSGTGKEANIPNENIAGKTGTNESEDGRSNTDLWFVGFNEKMVGSVWMGYDVTTSTNRIQQGMMSTYPARLFRDVGKEVLSVINKEDPKRNYKSIDFDIYKSSEDGSVRLVWEAEKGIKYDLYKNDSLVYSGVRNEFKDTLITGESLITYSIKGYDIKSGKEIYRSKEKGVEPTED